MNEEHPHHLLAQIPLTLSPFLSLPNPTPLPYSYKSLPSTLPPSVIDHPHPASSDPHQEEPKAAAYVTSQSGHSASPVQILDSCRALRSHVLNIRENATSEIKSWEDDIRSKELAAKRRLAPGWLDVENERRGLLPSRALELQTQTPDPEPLIPKASEEVEKEEEEEGKELDRMFGAMSMTSK